MVRIIKWGPTKVQKIRYIGWDVLGAFHKFLKTYEELRYEIKCFWVFQIDKEDERLELPIWDPQKCQKKCG